MIERIAGVLANKMIKEELINEDQKEEYLYVLVIITEKYIISGTVLIIGFLLDLFLPTSIFLCTFFSLRKRTGGYHANSFLKCYLYTNIIYIIVVLIHKNFGKNFRFMMLLMIISIVIIEVIGTINHPKMDLDNMELKESKKAARIITALYGFFIFFLVAVGINITYISFMVYAVILCALLLCLAKIIRQEVIA